MDNWCSMCGKNKKWINLTDQEIILLVWGDFGVDQEIHKKEIVPIVKLVQQMLKDKNT